VIGSGIRDLIEGHDGRRILWTDNDILVSLRTKQGTSGELLFAEKCSGCHQSAPNSGNRIGPNLFGVVGQNVASLTEYPDYSPALQRLGGVWKLLVGNRLPARFAYPVAAPGRGRRSRERAVRDCVGEQVRGVGLS
jgi:hypothetical protein